ncbi:hypothetical protein [Kribbella sp. NPDC051770]|uniref:hypothetical protein n=1 Tax=Kribbella sp. NPDC051770 TaxID=3155413 RepID=UPI00343BA750
MSVRGWKIAATMAVLPLALAACGNDKPGTGSPAPLSTAPTGPASTPTPTGTPTEGTPTATPSATPSGTPTGVPTPTKTPGKPVETPTPLKPVRLTNSMLLTGGEVAKGDPKRGWAATAGSASTPICGRGSTRGDGVLGALSRNFTNGLDADGGQWLTRYADAKAATAAYDSILKTIASCKAARPAPTHARKVTENRAIAVGDATRIVRWYDYPLPSDPGSEDGGFPYAVTRKGAIVSVVAFREMGKGIKPANFEAVARSAAAHLG